MDYITDEQVDIVLIILLKIALNETIVDQFMYDNLNAFFYLL